MWGNVGESGEMFVILKPQRPKYRNMRLIGTVDARLDSKGRAFLPALFRRSLFPAKEGGREVSECRLIMRKDVFENCLVLYPEEVWYQRLDELRAKLSVWNRQEQAIYRQFVKDAEWITLDSNGRFLIPKRYLLLANIDLDVTFVGMDSTIEVWAKQSLENTSMDDFGTSLEQLMTNSAEK